MKRTVCPFVVALGLLVSGGCTPDGGSGGDDDPPSADMAPTQDGAPEPDPDMAPEPDGTPEPEPDAAPEPGPDANPEPEPDAAPEPEPDAAPEPEPDAAPEPEPDAAPEPEPDAAPEPEPDAAPEPEPDAGPPGDPGTCGAPFDIEIGDLGEGSTADAPSAHGGSCGADGAPEAVWRLRSPVDTTACVRTNGSDFDTVLHVRRDRCADGAEAGCDDDGGEGTRSALTVELRRGQDVYIFVDGFSGLGDPAAGDYRLRVLDGPCAANAECVDDGDCRGDDRCAGGACSPPPECDADRPCPPAFVCEAGRCVDPPLDPPGTCGNPIPIAVGDTVEGDTRGAPPSLEASCGSDAEGPDVLYALAVERDGPLCVTSDGSDFDTVLHAYIGACGGPEAGCDDDGGEGSRSALDIDGLAGVTYIVAMDGYGGVEPAVGRYRLRVFAGTCAERPRCLADADCPAGEVCRAGQCGLEPACLVDAQCPGAEMCVDGQCVPECLFDAECAAGERCDEGACVPDGPACDVDGDCPPGWSCDGGRCAEPPPTCADDAECAPGTLCLGGDCIEAQCRADAECDQGRLCIRNRCRTNQSGGDCEFAPAPEVFIGLGGGAAGRLFRDRISDGRSCVEVDGADGAFVYFGDGGRICATTRGSTIDTVLRVHTDACDFNPTVVACNDDAPAVTGGSQAAVVFDTEPRERYWIIVDSRSGEAGDFFLQLWRGECPLDPGCEVNGDCGAGQRCVQGVCRECSLDRHCLQDGEACFDGECRPAARRD